MMQDTVDSVKETVGDKECRKKAGKSAGLIAAAATLLSVGTPLVSSGEHFTGGALIALGLACLGLREALK